MSPLEHLALSIITLAAATVNGALGYGFSSLTVPLALLFLTNRVLNPALVLIEVVLNAYVLIVNRRSLPAVWRRMLPLIVGLAPGVLAGTHFLARLDPAWMKLWTFAWLIPLILLQAAGYRRPLAWGPSFVVGFGAGLGLLYSVTTISGPPLALLLNNQGSAKREFRAALGLVRLAESSMTAIAYLSAGLFSASSLQLSLQILPSLAVGVPVGVMVFRGVHTETFRRLCMSFDAWVVAFGLASLLRLMQILNVGAAGVLFAAVALIDAWLLYRYFRVGSGGHTPRGQPRPSTVGP